MCRSISKIGFLYSLNVLVLFQLTNPIERFWSQNVHTNRKQTFVILWLKTCDVLYSYIFCLHLIDRHVLCTIIWVHCFIVVVFFFLQQEWVALSVRHFPASIRSACPRAVLKVTAVRSFHQLNDNCGTEPLRHYEILRHEQPTETLQAEDVMRELAPSFCDGRSSEVWTWGSLDILQKRALTPVNSKRKTEMDRSTYVWKPTSEYGPRTYTVIFSFI